MPFSWGCLENHTITLKAGFPRGSVVKNPPANEERQLCSPTWEDLLEKEMATH